MKNRKFALRSKQKCTICSEEISTIFNPMVEWLLEGVLCGDCYSKKLSDFYPGDHANLTKK
jgi:hypothetical protein